MTNVHSLPALLLAALAPLLQQPSVKYPVLAHSNYPQPANVPRPEFWVTNGSCSAAAFDDDTLYIGGIFSHVGPFTGSFAVVGADDGQTDLAQPKISASVRCVAGDNLGGWYLGGSFVDVGGPGLSRLVHVLPSGAVDTLFRPQVDGDVYALALAQSSLYVAGSYQHIGGQAIPALARVDAASGTADPLWHPLQGVPGPADPFSTLVIHGNTLYLMGMFDSPAILPRRYLAAFDLVSGVLLPWNPNANGSVFDLVVSGSTVYVGGNFSSIGGQPRNRIAALDLNSGSALPLNPNANSTVFCIGLSGTTLYAGGLFTALGGQARGRGGAVDTGSGALLPWNPAIAGLNEHEIDDLLIRNGTVYVGGKFAGAGGQTRWNLAQLDGLSGAATSWRVDVAGENTPTVDHLANQGPRLALAGVFRTVGGVERESAAAFDRTSGQLKPWHPSVWSFFGAPDPGQVAAILPTPNGVYLGGVFSGVNAIAVRDLALVDGVSGATDPTFQPSYLDNNGFVWKILLYGNRLYYGGYLNPGATGPHSLAALDPVTGRTVAPTLGVGGTVYDMAFSPDHSQLYVCGQFDSAGTPPVPRNCVASLDPVSGAVLPWYPALGNGMVASLSAVADAVYLAGTFNSIAAQPRQGLARVDPASGALHPWTHLLEGGTPDCVLAAGRAVFLGGGFSVVDHVGQSYAASLDGFHSMQLLDWAPHSFGCSQYLYDGRGFAAIGSFGLADGSRRPNFSVFDLR
jgi:hypothetical protein